MSMRKQIYQWTLNGKGAYNSDDYPNAGEEVSIFTGNYGNIITEANLIREDRFVVVHQFAVIVETFHLEADYRSARGEWAGCLTTGYIGESLRHPRQGSLVGYFAVAIRCFIVFLCCDVLRRVFERNLSCFDWFLFG